MPEGLLAYVSGGYHLNCFLFLRIEVDVFSRGCSLTVSLLTFQEISDTTLLALDGYFHAM